MFSNFARQEGDSGEITLMKRVAFFVSLSCSTCGLLWSLLYYQIFGVSFITALPLTFVVVVGLAATIAHLTKKHHILIYAQIFCIMWVTTLIQWSIGSVDQSGLVIAWSFLGPAGAMIFLNRAKAIVLMLFWVFLMVISMYVEPNLFGNSYDLPKETKALFYITNLGASYTVIFLSFLFLHHGKERLVGLLKKNRELERTNYEQELLLRQSEKLATLGRLSAGIAHELNNPSAAVQRGAERLQKAIPNLNEAQYQLGINLLSEEELEIAKNFVTTCAKAPNGTENLGSLELSDKEYEMESALEALGITNAWELAPELVSVGVDKEKLEILKQQFGLEKMKPLLSVLYHLHLTNNLLEEVNQGTLRISEIIKALKSYTYMDQSPLQFININEGLQNTLVMLRSKLKQGVAVHKDFAENLPQVNGYGSELNQVWTNLIDNAVDAMDGNGEVFLKTWSQENKVYVEVKDLGKGISDEAKSHIFDPFFTTKEQGKGTGLGLHISYNIIVNKHHGDITVNSRPGETIFKVELPIQHELEPSPVES